MTVEELIKILSEYDSGDVVYASIDAGGNASRPVTSVEPMTIVNGEALYRGPLTEEMRSEGYNEDDVSSEGILAAVMWP